MTDIAVTCKYAATFWTPEKLHIICKTSKKACCQTVAEGGCIGKHKVQQPTTKVVGLCSEATQSG